MSIASSVYDKSISSDIAFVADVGLTGELKKIPSLELRIKELDRMGFKKVYIAKDSIKNMPVTKIEIKEYKTLTQVIADIFGSKKVGNK